MSGLAWSGPVRFGPVRTVRGTVFAPPETIFHNFRIFSKNRFFDVFGGSWGPGMVLDRLGILKKPRGLISAPELVPRAVLSIFRVQKKSRFYEKYFDHKTSFQKWSRRATGGKLDSWMSATTLVWSFLPLCFFQFLDNLYRSI